MRHSLTLGTLLLLALTCALLSRATAQSETGHCNYLSEQYVTAFEEQQKAKNPDFGSKDWDQEFARWKKEFDSQSRKLVEAGRLYLGECRKCKQIN